MGKNLNLNYKGIAVLAKVLAKKANLGHQWIFPDTSGGSKWDRSEYGKKIRHIGQPYTDYNTIYTPYPDPSLSGDQLEEVAGTTYHEIYHNTPECKEDRDVMEENKIYAETLYGTLFNVLCDNRAEHLNHGTFRGADQIVGNTRSRFAKYRMETELNDDYLKTREKLLDKFRKEATPEEFEAGLKKADMMDALYAWDIKARTDWQPSHHGLYDTLLPRLSERSQEWAERLSKYTEEYTSLEPWKSGSEHMKGLMDRLVTEVFDYTEEELNEMQQESRDAFDKKQAEAAIQPDGNGESDGGGDGYGSDEARGKGGDSKGKDGPPGSLEEYLKRLYQNRVKDAHGEPKEAKGHHVSYEGHEMTRGTGFMPSPDQEILQGKDFKINAGDEKWAASAQNKYALPGGGLAGTVRKLLQVLSQAYWVGGKKRGRLNSRALHRITHRDTSLFKDKEQALVTDVAVTVLTDMSGSMGGYEVSKYACAAMATAHLNDAISVSGIPLEILGFSEEANNKFSGSYPVHTIFKTFKERISGDKIIKMFAHRRDHLCNNSDGESILWAYERLVTQPEKRKLLIVLSDGSPSCYNDTGDEASFTKEVIEEIEERSPVEIYGIGIQDRNVKRFYKEHVTIREAHELETALMKVIKTKILRR
jgi:hypothetical protein|tara:strand:+ start:835 stop:2772 length:1938 start_codon:yes stop_codon:yes gene_type:complete